MAATPRHCSHCGAALSPEMRSCGSCGSPAAVPEAGRSPAPKQRGRLGPVKAVGAFCLGLLGLIAAGFLAWNIAGPPARQISFPGFPLFLQISAPTAAALPGASGEPFTFISWADTHAGTAELASLSGQVKKLRPALTIYPGDLSGDFSVSGMNAWTNVLNGKDGSGLAGITFPVRGNHDDGDISGWESYFDMAGAAERIGASHFTALAQNLTYAFTYNNAVFIGVDVPGSAKSITSDELSYLDDVLTNAEQRGLLHAFIFFHGPVYAVSSHTGCPTRTCPTASGVAELVMVLNKHKIVSATFHGHEHVQAYVHLDSSRLPEITHPFEEFITGTAGAKTDKCDKAFRFDYCGSFSGFTAVTVSGKAFTVNIYRQNWAGPVKKFTFNKP